MGREELKHLCRHWLHNLPDDQFCKEHLQNWKTPMVRGNSLSRFPLSSSSIRPIFGYILVDQAVMTWSLYAMIQQGLSPCAKQHAIRSVFGLLPACIESGLPAFRLANPTPLRASSILKRIRISRSISWYRGFVKIGATPHCT